MALTLSTKLVNDLMTAGSFKTLLEDVSGGSGFKITVYSTTRPASADTAPGGTPLVTITAAGGLPLTFDATATAGVLLKDPAETWSGTAAATGTAVWFRVSRFSEDATITSTTLHRFDGSIATSGGDMNVGSTSIVSGAPFLVTAGSFTLPQGSV
jgi:hypothetical protein